MDRVVTPCFLSLGATAKKPGLLREQAGPIHSDPGQETWEQLQVETQARGNKQLPQSTGGWLWPWLSLNLDCVHHTVKNE